MDDRSSPSDRLSHFIHERFIWLLIGSYAVASVLPGLGMAIRDVSFGEVHLLGEKTRLSLPMLMLAFLLFNAGLGVRTAQLRDLLRAPLALIGGLVANLLIPIAFIFGVSQMMRIWHNPDEVQNILVGLALVASMPIAGSSTAWSQNANGNLALSLGLVLASTFLSPLTTPLALHSVGLMARGEYAADLHELAGSGTGGFLAICVILPSILGIVSHMILGEARVAAIKPRLKLVNSMILLVLNYSNASLSLPQAIANPDWDFLGVVLTITLGLCGLAFASGWMISRLMRVDESQRTSLMFGLGMNNNGTGLVLAAMMLAGHPRVMIPIIFYNLVQHLVAGLVDHVAGRTPRPPASIPLPAIRLFAGLRSRRSPASE
ncbi:MAG: putative Na+-dependent transporter [Planctomycetota bacterium]|nr:putative Na+-dependent transporter [Planctomycetota bacterium]